MDSRVETLDSGVQMKIQWIPRLRSPVSWAQFGGVPSQKRRQIHSVKSEPILALPAHRRSWIFLTALTFGFQNGD